MKRLLLPLALAGLFAGPALAGDPGLRAGLVLRTGTVFSPEDKLHPFTMGAGLSVDMPLSPRWTLRGELAYTYRAGRTYRADLSPAATGMPPVDPELSGDARKNKLDALMLRVGALRALTPEWSLQAGLGIGKSRFTHEYIGNAMDTDRTYEDTYNGVPVQSSLHVSPFVGVQWLMDPDTCLELNLVGQGYTAIDFRHIPGSPLVGGDPERPGSHLVYQGDHLEKVRRVALGAELGLRFRF